MKALFKYDATTKQWAGTSLVADNYELQANETFTELPTGINLPATFDGTTWQPASDADHEAYTESIQPVYTKTVELTPTDEQQMINALGLQVASLQAAVTKLTTTNGGAA